MNPSDFGATFHHIGIACRDLDDDEGFFTGLGYFRERDDVEDTIQGVRARFMTGPGPRMELVCNLPERTVLSEFLKKGVKMYHIAYEVDDLPSMAAELASLGAKQIGAASPGIAFGMRDLAFFMLPNGMLVEMITRAPAGASV